MIILPTLWMSRKSTRPQKRNWNFTGRKIARPTAAAFRRFFGMAEGEGFEPPVRLPVRLISSQVPLTTQPPFRVRKAFCTGLRSRQADCVMSAWPDSIQPRIPICACQTTECSNEGKVALKSGWLQSIIAKKRRREPRRPLR